MIKLDEAEQSPGETLAKAKKHRAAIKSLRSGGWAFMRRPQPPILFPGESQPDLKALRPHAPGQ